MKKLFVFAIALILILGLCCGPAFAADIGPGDMAGSVADAISGLAVVAGVVLTVLGILTIAVQIIVAVTKEVPPIKAVPTKLWVIIVSLVVCELALFILASWAGFLVLWYYIVMALFMAMVVAYISMNGWDALKELYDRYMIRKLKT